MKYKEIKLENNKSVLVDESAEIINYDDEPYLLIQDDYETYTHKHKGDNIPTTKHFKIIATINHSISLDVPMVVVKDEIEKLVLFYKNKKGSIPTTELEDEIFALAFKDGYKAAQQKGVYSEEDLREAIAESWNTCEDNENNETFTEMFYRIIQSLKQEYIELEMEEILGDEGIILSLDNKDWKIKTNRDVGGQLMAYLKQ